MCAREGASRCGTLCSEKMLEREVWLDTVVSRDRATLKSASSLPFSSFELALCCAALPAGRGEGRRKPWLSMPRGDRHQHCAKLSAQVPTEPVMGATWSCSGVFPDLSPPAQQVWFRWLTLFSSNLVKIWRRPLFICQPAGCRRDGWAWPSQPFVGDNNPPRKRGATPIAPDS
eukprot:scaffold74831_cov67-Phaeocystis_antarctica.AAC.3